MSRSDGKPELIASNEYVRVIRVWERWAAYAPGAALAAYVVEESQRDGLGVTQWVQVSLEEGWYHLAALIASLAGKPE